jgi:hypothetical protein
VAKKRQSVHYNNARAALDPDLDADRAEARPRGHQRREPAERIVRQQRDCVCEEAGAPSREEYGDE